MAIEPNGPAPYAPPSSVLTFLQVVRDKNLPTPYDREVVARAGISDALAPRVLKTLKLYELVDKDNNPTEQLDVLAKAGNSDYKERLAEILRSAYADVFQFVDPATDSVEKIEDQFRNYSPKGQRERMVTLFLTLCAFTGIAPQRERTPSTSTTPKKKRVSVSKSKRVKEDPGAAGTSSNPPAKEAPLSDAKQRYVDLLLKKAEEDADPSAMFDRIERVLGVSDPAPKGGDDNS